MNSGVQPRAAKRFFVRYQDRILFGKDTYEVPEYPFYFGCWRVMTSGSITSASITGFGSLYALDLPDDSVEKGLLQKCSAPVSGTLDRIQRGKRLSELTRDEILRAAS